MNAPVKLRSMRFSEANKWNSGVPLGLAVRVVKLLEKYCNDWTLEDILQAAKNGALDKFHGIDPKIKKEIIELFTECLKGSQ